MNNPEHRAPVAIPDIASSGWINAKVREELGFAPNNIYYNEEDMKHIEAMNDMEREMLIEDRNQKAEAARYKYECHRQQILMKQSQQKQVQRKRPQSQSDSEGSKRSSGDESSYGDRRKRRLQKGDQKMKRATITLNPDSESSESDQPESQDKQPVTAQFEQKPVVLQDFLKIVIKRKDMTKWVEHEEYRQGLKGAFVRVIYNKQYVLGMIDSFILGPDTYRVEQSDTRYQVMLSNRGKLKQFKINVVSDRDPIENEFYQFTANNPKIVISHSSIKRKVQEIQEATQFQYKKDELERLVNEQNYKKIQQGNFKGLNLTSIKMTVQGELSLAEAAYLEGESNPNYLEVQAKYEELVALMKVIDERTAFEIKDQASKDIKMGAQLVQISELEEWLLNQEQQKNTRVDGGSNVFTYKTKGRLQQEEHQVLDDKLIEELNRLTKVSSVSTRENSDVDKGVSFFKRVEGRKNAFKEATQKVNVSFDNTCVQGSSMYVRQPEHPFKAEERNILQIMANPQTSISLDEYFAHYY